MAKDPDVFKKHRELFIQTPKQTQAYAETFFE